MENGLNQNGSENLRFVSPYEQMLLEQESQKPAQNNVTQFTPNANNTEFVHPFPEKMVPPSSPHYPKTSNPTSSHFVTPKDQFGFGNK
ncbi:hypothetical protein MHBO_001757 [Bonamia ostreae]|uniref:Uncharacterized protein n=1 Tax=Bonamia ostreae TaxID=126728 RepID=A0ABV2AK18_9EUKA